MEEKENKSANILIRVSPTEKKIIEEKAKQANKSIAAYLLALSESRRITDTSKLAALIIEIRRIGVNINQIAAVANSQKYINKEMLAKVEQHEKEILNLLQQIINEVYDTEEHTLRSLEHKIDKLTDRIERFDTNGSS